MKRRQLLQQIGIMIGSGVLTPLLSNAFANVNLKSPLANFAENELLLMAEIGEIIVPTTKTAGAKTAKAHEYAFRIIDNCYTKSEKNRFLNELVLFNETCKSQLVSNFIDLKKNEKTEMVKGLISAKPQFFKEMKQLIVVGYFTSEEGATKALTYEPIPGKYIGCTPLKSGQKAWAI